MNDRTTMTDRLLLWVPGVVAVALLVAPFAMSSRLPDPIAIHWGLSGSPDGSGPIALIALISFVVVGAAWVIFVRAYRARVSSSEVSVSLGIVGVPRARYPLAGIVRAEVIDVRPMAFGGWGYRIVKGTRAWIVRAGEGVRLVRPDAFDVVITIDGAEGAAGLINDVLVKEGRFVSADAS